MTMVTSQMIAQMSPVMTSQAKHLIVLSMATTQTNVVSANNSNTNNASAVNEITATILSVSSDGTKAADKESNSIFIKIDTNLVQLDENGVEQPTDTFSKTPKCIFDSFVELDGIELLNAMVEGTPHKFEGYVPLLIMLLKGAKIRFTRRIAEKDEIINSVPMSRRAYVTENIKLINSDELNNNFWSQRGQAKFAMLSKQIKKTAAAKFEY